MVPELMGLATIKAYRRAGGAVVNVTRRGRTRRYVVGLARWRWLRHWCNVGGPYKAQGGYWGSNRLDVTIDTEQTWERYLRGAPRTT